LIDWLIAGDCARVWWRS